MSGPSELWEREESKVVRPFRSIDDYLADAEVRLHDNGDFLKGPVIPTESIDVGNLSLALKIAAPPPNLEDLVKAPRKDLALAISLEDRTLKTSAIVRAVPLDELDGDVIELGSVPN